VLRHNFTARDGKINPFGVDLKVIIKNKNDVGIG
jgi:hypothetical protein